MADDNTAASAPISADQLEQALAANGGDRLAQIELAVQAKIEWLQKCIDTLTAKGADHTEADAELILCNAWSNALAAGTGSQYPTATDDQNLLTAIRAVDAATAASAALGKLMAAAHQLKVAYAA